MLRSLHIRNIALIEDLTLDLSNGFLVFTGETGAGKSLVVDSLSLVLGARADRELVSHGKPFAEIEAVFEDFGESTAQKMYEFGLDEDDTLIVYRKIYEDGRNDCRVNGRSVTVGMLKVLASTLVDVCGQFENLTMFKPQNQLALIDSIAGNKSLLLQLNQKFDEIADVDKKLDLIIGDDKERERALDMLAFQIDEIEEAGFFDGEEEKLQEAHKKIVSKEKVISSLAEALRLIADISTTDVASEIKSAAQILTPAANAESEIDLLRERLVSASIEIEDIVSSLEGWLEEYQDESINVDEVESRLDLLNNFKKKYGKTIEDILSFCQQAKERFEMLKNSKETCDMLKTKKEVLYSEAMELAEQLHENRLKTSKNYANEIQKLLRELAMNGAKFDVLYEKTEKLSRSGFDDINFVFSANSGMPMRPLAKVASGGELSRFMLALKSVSAMHDNIQTLVFDEIDTGISGETGKVVGEKMLQISNGRQVICISHLPTIAALADKNYYLSKTDDGNKTTTEIELLDENKKIAEVARLVGGKAVGDFALLHAKDMVDQANAFKQTVLAQE